MRLPPFIISLCLSVSAFAQQGYVKLMNDSIAAGYMRYYKDASTGETGWEVWKTKKDKSPKRYAITSLHEYCYKKDTFRVFQDLKPFHDEDMYFDLIDLKAQSRGKINLYRISLQSPVPPPMPAPGPGLVLTIAMRIPVGGSKKVQGRDYVFVLENPETGFVSGVPSRRAEMWEVLLNFFPDRYLTRYEEEKEEISYKTLTEMVVFYNSR